MIKQKKALMVQRDALDDFVRFLLPRLPRDCVALKGGYVLGSVINQPARYTADVDLTILQGIEYGDIKPLLAEYGERIKAAGKSCGYEIKEDMIVGQRSGGAVYYGERESDLLMSVDISGSEIEFDTIKINLPDLGEVTVTSPEQVLSDKLAVLFSKKRFRRVKDLIDVHSIITGDVEIDMDRLQACLERRGIWPLPADKYPFSEDRLVQLEHAYDMFVRQSIDGRPIEKLDFKELVSGVSGILARLLDTEVLD